MILLTGASGFVGGELLLQLIERSVLPIRTYGRCESDKFNINYKITVEHVVGEICPEANYANALRGIDVIIHCAALAHITKGSELSFQDINTLATIELAKQARKVGVKRFVFISSIGVNGNATLEKPFSIFDEPKPLNSYTNSKYDAEIGLKKIAAETGLEVVIVRPTLVYGPNAPGNFGLLTKLVKKLPVLPFGLVNNKRDFIAVQNLADLLITCATHPNAAGHMFLASDMETVSIKQFTNAIADGLGKKVFQFPIPVSLMRLTGKLMRKSAMVEQLLGNLQVDSSNIKEVLDWTPPLTMKQAMTTLCDSGKSSSGKE